MIAARRLICLGLLLCAGCPDTTLVVGKFTVPGAAPNPAAGANGAGDGPAGAAAVGGAGGTAGAHPPRSVGIEPGSREQFCMGRGTALRAAPPSDAAADCDTKTERELFSYGLCACNDLQMQADSFLIDSFDSSQGAYVAGQRGAAVGVNGSLVQLATDTQVLGSLFAAGSGLLSISGTGFVVSGDFKTNATLQASKAGTRIARDLWIAGDVIAQSGAIEVQRDAYQAQGHTGIGDVSVKGQLSNSRDFSVPAPCPCDDASLLDIPALVAQARSANDNAVAGWAPDALTYSAWLTDTKNPPCGRLFVNSISLESGCTIAINPTGRTAIFVDGDVKVAAFSTLFLLHPLAAEKLGELDVFIRGNLTLADSSTILFGDGARPAALRVYVAGDISIAMTSTIPLGAQLYAPHATVTVPVPNVNVDAWGSIFARNIKVMGAQRMHYDRAILRASAECSAPAPRCDGCNQCPGGLACIAGVCGACAADSDCCAPAVCSNGTCQPLL